MRKWIWILIALWARADLIGQDCPRFFPFEEQAWWEYASFDKSGNKENVFRRRITQLGTIADGGVRARIETIAVDAEGQETKSSTYEVACSGKEMRFDVVSTLSPKMTQAFSNIDLTISGDDLVLPIDLEPGQTLPPAKTEILAENDGVNLINMTISITGRKVEARETITTGSGAVYDCFRIRYVLQSKVLIVKTFDVVEWFAEGYGVIRSETYNRKGELDGFTELQTFKRPSQ